MELNGDKHIFISPTIAGSNLSQLSNQDIIEEEACSKSIMLLKCSNDVKFGELYNQLKDGTYLDRDKNPI